MGNTNNDKILNSVNKHNETNRMKEKKIEKDAFKNKKDVDEFNISEEYFTKPKQETDGEDF
jgi:hypothetical protein